MSVIVFSFHCALVFGVPSLFGWVLLRRVFRESTILTLIPGSVVAGAAALMAAVNELRFFFEMKLAVWFAYKLLLVITLILIVAVRSHSSRLHLPAIMSRAWKLILVVTGAILTAIYFGVPAFGGFLHDAWWFHYPAVIQIQNVERFPLNHVFALDGPLYYHHGPDVLAATWSFLLEMPVQRTWALFVAILAPCSFLLAFALLVRLSRNFWSALIGASLLVAGGNLRFLFILTGDYSGTLGLLQVFNSQTVQGLIQLMFTPSHALGVPLVLLILVLLRNVVARTSWLLSASLGLVLGTLTLVAEWYFLPSVAGVTSILLFRAWHLKPPRHQPTFLALSILPAVVALSWGAFNNTYISGLLGHFWMRYDNVSTLASSRQIVALWEHQTQPHQPYLPVPSAPLAFAPFAFATLQIAPLTSASIASSSFVPLATTPNGSFANAPLNSAPLLSARSNFAPPASVEKIPFDIPPSSTAVAYQPKWSVPNLVPLRLNLKHLGQVPSWESAASNGDSFIPVFGLKFLLEAAPVLLVGIPFGLWLAWRRRNPVVMVLAWLALSCVVPPILLDWGYRSTDFLRFFTASYSFAALFTGWLAGELLTQPGLRPRLLGGILTASCLITPISLGFIGLMPGTIAKVNAISAGAQSLSEAAAKEKSSATAAPAVGLIAQPAATPTDPNRAQAFEKLALQTGDFLFPLTHGRERAIVIVPPDQIPEVKYFPEWMKLATLARLQLPIGWHWQDSEYSAFYRDASSRLDARAITSLDAKWVIVSNLFQDTLPMPVIETLRDRSRFIPIATFREGRWFMSAYRVLP